MGNISKKLEGAELDGKEVEKIANTVTKRIDAKYNEVLAVNKRRLNNDLLGQSATGEFFCDLMRKEMQTDIVFFNGGGVRAEVPKGKVTYRTIKDVFPFPNKMVKLAMTGKDIHVAPEDMGKVIGKQGRIAKAIRIVMKAAATRENVKVIIDIG